MTPGAEVGPYRLLERIGSGGMGIVYAAFDPRLDRKVALKLLRPELAALDPGMELRLVRESKAMARLSHPNVLAIHDIGALAGQVWLAMELVEGETLRAWLRTPRPWREVLAVFVAAGRGLAAAHAAGLVHRDFKPDNVLLDRGGRVLVTDFGLARPAEAAVTGSGRAAPVGDLADELTHTGALVGTPAYCAPEQQRGEATDERSDVFSFCVALHEGLHGERPFAGAPPRDPDAPWRLAAPGRRVPGWLHRAVTRGLQREPDRRYPSMNALLDALRPPRHVRAYISVGAVIVAATVGATAALLRAPPDERAQACGAARLGDGWDDARRELVRGALLVADTRAPASRGAASSRRSTGRSPRGRGPSPRCAGPTAPRPARSPGRAA
ncbi:serine/threonine-protein kinase [Nannocystis pusilla]|uniref:serine/threonine-protein kinase n=1 Tax=Nannocystis pusilla TaxID=889268 RepID=UPI003B7D4538